MKLRWLLLISILMLLSGCKEAPGSEPGTGANADSRPIFQDVETVSVDVMHSDRKFSDSTTIEPGHWEKAEELFLGPVFLKGEPAGSYDQTERKEGKEAASSVRIALLCGY
ncbi:MAG: hypothetical protein IKD66_05090 [Solobacterium sp.]|nr:hypothetical protein [Solobacterium sp.]